jgi:hypothetical protein
MNPKLHNYKLCPDGFYRRKVSFDVHNRPELCNVVNLVRDSKGNLRKSETVGWRRKTAVDKVKTD